MINRLLEYANQGSVPNKLSLEMGKRIREAREERGLSQDELAKKVYKRRPSLSEIENGKMYPDVATLLMIALVLQRPIVDFFPAMHRHQLAATDLSDEEEQLILQFRRIRDEDQQRLALTQIKAIADIEGGWA